MSILSIIIDQREPQHITGADYGAPSQTALLPAGDVMVATADNHILLIERKTPLDLLGSIADGRLFHQLAAMREQTEWCYLCITGPIQADFDGRVNGTGWRHSSVQGALLTAQECGVHVVYSDGESDFAACVQRLAKRDRGPLRLPAVRQANVYGEGETILSSLPGIGPEKAITLIKAFPNTAWAFQFLTDPEWKSEVPGVANGTKARVRRAMGLDDRHMLAVIPIEAKDDEENVQS